MIFADDIVVNCAAAFGMVERVVVEQVSPNLARPEYRYVVPSARTGQRYQLRHAYVISPHTPQPKAPGNRRCSEQCEIQKFAAEAEGYLNQHGCSSVTMIRRVQ